MNFKNINISPIITKYAHIFVIPSYFSGTVGCLLAAGYQLNEPTPHIFKTAYSFLVGGVYGLLVGAMWPVSITIMIYKDINDCFTKKQIL
jgi:hypothetical protein